MASSVRKQPLAERFAVLAIDRDWRTIIGAGYWSVRPEYSQRRSSIAYATFGRGTGRTAEAAQNDLKNKLEWRGDLEWFENFFKLSRIDNVPGVGEA